MEVSNGFCSLRRRATLKRLPSPGRLSAAIVPPCRFHDALAERETQPDRRRGGRSPP